MEDRIRNIFLEMVELSKELLEKSDITTNEIEMSLALLGEAKNFFC